MTNNQTPIQFPSTSGEVVEHLISQGYDAHDALRSVNLIVGSAFVGTKVTLTAYKKIVAFLDGSDRPFISHV
jgi:hypothetical protein